MTVLKKKVQKLRKFLEMSNTSLTLDQKSHFSMDSPHRIFFHQNTLKEAIYWKSFQSNLNIQSGAKTMYKFKAMHHERKAIKFIKENFCVHEKKKSNKSKKVSKQAIEAKQKRKAYRKKSLFLFFFHSFAYKNIHWVEFHKYFHFSIA